MLQLTNENFDEKITNGVTVVDFWAEWCMPCKMMAPVFEELSRDYPNVQFAKVDTQKYGTLANKNNVTGIPCLIVFKDGSEIGRIVGFAPKESIKQRLDVILKDK